MQDWHFITYMLVGCVVVTAIGVIIVIIFATIRNRSEKEQDFKNKIPSIKLFGKTIKSKEIITESPQETQYGYIPPKVIKPEEKTTFSLLGVTRKK